MDMFIQTTCKNLNIYSCMYHTQDQTEQTNRIQTVKSDFFPPFIIFLHNFYKSLPIAILLIYQLHCHFYTDESTKWSDDVVKFFLSSHGAKHNKNSYDMYS